MEYEERILALEKQVALLIEAAKKPTKEQCDFAKQHHPISILGDKIKQLYDDCYNRSMDILKAHPEITQFTPFVSPVIFTKEAIERSSKMWDKGIK